MDHYWHHHGTAQNIMAKDCVFGIDFRVVPGEDGRVGNGMPRRGPPCRGRHAGRAPETSIKIETRASVPGLRPEENGAAETLARSNGRQWHTRGQLWHRSRSVSGAGYSACICGPGDIAQAHQADEFISIAQMDEGQKFMERVDRMGDAAGGVDHSRSK